ncbi:uncharacterized protein LOC142537510 [Primulina tabacum]|uniref:uncharacterized protein LOC142537510 n=1 Tax=Primulina tabacum TaxID=48773 RepID=UPI003F5A1CDE
MVVFDQVSQEAGASDQPNLNSAKDLDFVLAEIQEIQHDIHRVINDLSGDTYLYNANELTISYHQSEANKVVDALSWKNMGKVIIASLSTQSCLRETVKLNQDEDPTLENLKEQVKEGKSQVNHAYDKGVIWIKGRLCVSGIDNLQQKIIFEAHRSKFSFHLGSTKMYRDLKKNFLWSGMKKDVTEFISKFQVCQQVEAEHQ